MLNRRKKIIDAVEVDDRELESLPPKYRVKIKYTDGTVENTIMTNKTIQAQYGTYLKKNDESKRQEYRYTP